MALGNGATAAFKDALAIGACSDLDQNGTIDPATECITASNSSALALASGAQATGIGSTAIGGRATASGRLSLAIGPNANATDTRAFAIGLDSIASARGSMAIGEDANASHDDSVAFGAGATTLLANQMMLGTTSMTYTIPGITTQLSKDRQVGAVYYVTSDANGNLAVTDDPVPPGGSSKPSPTSSPTPANPGAASATSGSNSTSVGTTGARDASDHGDRGAVVNGSPFEGEFVDNDLIGSSLEFGGTANATPIPGNGIINGTLDAESLSLASVNAEAIEVNRQEIAKNSIKIDQAFVRIASNTNAIAVNSLRLTDVEQSMAAVAALPDMYLASGESMTASGAVAAVGSEVGFGATFAIRANETWSVGASIGMGGDERTGKIQMRWVQ